VSEHEAVQNVLWLISSTADPTHADTILAASRQSSAYIRSQAIAQGQAQVATAPLYPNYAIYDTPLNEMYGDNIPKLKALKVLVDPLDVMGLAGGYKF